VLADVLQALHDWEVAAAIRRSLYIYPFVNALHIFSIGLLVGGILPADLRMLGLFRSVPLAPFLRLMTAFAATGLALAIASGFLLFSVQPLEYAGNVAFLAKIALVGVGALLALAVRFSPSWREAINGGGVSSGLRIAAVASMSIWLAALLCGRWIAFV
jgi:hypothetical protein